MPRLLPLLVLLAASSARAACPGDCDADGVVEPAELALGVEAALGLSSPCAGLDADGSGVVSVADLVVAAEHARRGCALATCSFSAGALPSATLPPGTPLGEQIPIDHVLVVMQENRSFDHYFGTLDHDDADVIPPGFTNPDAGGLPVAPFHDPATCTPDVDHSWNGTHRQWNGGLMDGFVVTNEPGGERAMAHYVEADLPFYHALARTFALSDRFFCDVPGPTFPNRYYLYCGTSFGKIDNDVPLQGWPQRTIFDVLSDRGISWRIYRSDAIAFGFVFTGLRGSSNVKPLSQFFADAASGNLPSVAFLDPSFTGVGSEPTDEHAPSNVQRGQAFVASLVNALVASPDWPRSVLFWTYDEHGGYFDHVPPPPGCVPDAKAPELGPGDEPGAFDRLGIRIPFVAVSPWARPGHVSHLVHTNASILRFIQARFGLPAMTARDANSLALLDLFDFSAPARLAPPALPAALVDPVRDAACP